jgi:hypothetical protein
MNHAWKTGKIALLIALPLFFGACVRIRVIRHVDDPGPYFEREQKRVERLQQGTHPGRGRAHDLCVFAYESGENQIVRCRVPLWLVRLALHAGLEAAEHDPEWREWRHRYQFDWSVVRDLDSFGRGLLVAVDDERDKVLVWIE